MPHDHGFHGKAHHGHSHHGHSHHDPQRESQRISFAFWLNLSFTIIEIIGGVLTNSVAILSNAIHDLGDTLAIGFGWGASRIAQRHPDDAYTYGYRRLSLLSALVIGLTLVVGSVIVIINALPRLWQPQEVHSGGMFWLAVLGIGINGAAALGLRGGHTQNEKVLSWHLIEDVLGWVAILIASVVIHFTHWNIIDPLLSIGFTLFILFNVLRSLRETLQLFLQKSPDETLTEKIKTELLALPGVGNMHHVHLWSLDGQHHVLTAHVALTQDFSTAEQLALKQRIHHVLESYALTHTTIELELPAEACRDN
ncbi:MAG: Cation transporter [Verrucomicrobiaceae bacterium]|nr:Cation transporter [Verrucomicrobiaceae bacterium]